MDIQGAAERQVPSGTVQAEPVLVATAVTYCVPHAATDHDDGRAWSECRFRQLFYFENPMNEHSMIWNDEIGAAADPGDSRGSGGERS